MNDNFFEQLVSLEENEARRKCRNRVRDTYSSLQKKTKRVRPENFIPFLVNKFRQLPKGDYVLLPPHVLLHAIEANCSYHKDGYDEQATWGKMVDIRNIIISENFAPYETYSIHHNLHLFMQHMHRTQLEIQKSEFSRKHFARYWKLFIENEFTPRLFSAFEEKYGLAVEKWFKYSFGAYSMLRCDLMIQRDPIKIEKPLPFSNDDFQKYFDLSVLTVKQVKDRYFESRKNIDPEFHYLIRTCFLERPILQLPNNKLISPIPKLIFRHVGYGLYDLFESLDPDGYYIGKSFQAYARNVLEELEMKTTLAGNNLLEKYAQGQSCDFVLSTEHENILIECKATLFKVNTLTQNAIANHTSTTNICKGLGQIQNTLDQIEEGGFADLDINTTKPFIGIVLTLGEIPFANSDWYFQEILPNNKAGKKLTRCDNTSKLIVKKPLILSVNALENLITYMNITNESLISICDQKEKKGYSDTGDWEAFLGNKLSELKNTAPLKFIESVMEEFDAHLGLNTTRQNNK